MGGRSESALNPQSCGGGGLIAFDVPVNLSRFQTPFPVASSAEGTGAGKWLGGGGGLV